MSDLVLLQQGELPWRPSSTSQVVRVFHEYTVPLVGVIEQDAVQYLFWCVTGHAAPESAWAYASIHDAALVDALESGSDAFDDNLMRAVDGQTIAFAVASDEKGLIQFVYLDPPADFDTAYSRGMEELREKFQEVLAEYERLGEVFPALRDGATFRLAPTQHSALV